MRVFSLIVLAMLSICIVAFSPAKDVHSVITFRYIGPSFPESYTVASNWFGGRIMPPCESSGAVVCRLIPHNPNIDEEWELAAEIAANGFDNITILDFRE